MTNPKSINDQQVDMFYTDHEGKVWPEETWETFDGRKILVKDLEPEHAKNIIRMILRSNKQDMDGVHAMAEALETLIAQIELQKSGQLLN